MAALLLSSLVSLLLFTTFGVSVARIVKVPTNFAEKILLGLVVSNTLTTCLSLFFPINFLILLLFILTCSFLLIFIRDELNTLWASLYKNKYVIFCSLPFIITALIISLSYPDTYDTGLYHLQGIKWIEEYPAVPGLANLHGRLGFNPNIFTFFALTSLKELFGQEIFSVNFTVFSVLAIYFINKSYSLFKHQGFSNLFVFCSFVFLIILPLHGLSSPTPDFLTMIISFFVFVRIVDLSSEKENSEFKSYIPVLILSIYTLTVKLAALPLVLLFVFFIIRYKSEFQNSLLWMLPSLCFIILPYLIRNIILTGWLVYPFPSLDLFSFDWKVPLAGVISGKEAVTGWARNPGDHYVAAANMDFIGWFPIWWRHIGLIERLFFVSSLTFSMIALIGQLIKKLKINLLTNAVIITSFMGVLFWLFTAPEFRFGESFIVVASISVVLYLRFHWKATYPNILFSLMIILSIGFFTKLNDDNIKTNIYEIIYSNRMIIPKGFETPTNENFETWNINGLEIYVPTNGERCFNHALPCTPYPDTTLILRGKTLKSGFKHIVK